MSWGLEAGAGMDAAAREERHSRRIRIPANALGHVPRLLVVGDETDERAVECPVQRREQERKRRLGDTRVRRKIVNERVEALARGEGIDEAGER
jgi:hypothetical protein